MRHAKIFAAEFIGTMLLLTIGFSALFNGTVDSTLGLALVVGFTVVALSAVMGPVSGAHLNPAVTIGLAILRRTDPDKVPTYLVAQFLGGIAGGFLSFVIARGRDGGFSPDDSNFAISGWEQLGSGFDWFSMAITVTIVTSLLVMVYSALGARAPMRGGSSLAAGLAYAVGIYAGLGIVGTSMNPSLSFGTAIFAGGDAFEQVWLIMLFQLVGAVAGVLMWLAVDDADLEDTMLGESALARRARDIATSGVDHAAGAASSVAGAVGDVADKAGDAADSVKDRISGDRD